MAERESSDQAMLELAMGSVVITANVFNPSIFSQMWLARCGSLRDSDQIVQSLVSAKVSQVETSLYSFTVVEGSLSFVAKNPRLAGELVVARLGPLVRELPHTPFTAIGVNFTWHLVAKEGMASFTRSRFYRSPPPGFTDFGDPNARFGFYASKDVGAFRMKVSAQPAKDATGAEFLQVSFNFHHDLQQDAAASITERIGQWQECLEMSEHMVGCMR